MKIGEVKETFDLYCQANGVTAVRIVDLAKELEVRVTALMKYINENSGLFKISYSSKANKGSDKVLLIKEVFLTTTDNPDWLPKQITDNEKCIYIRKWENWGHVEGYYVDVDEDDERSLWRNTESKIQYLKKEGVLREGVFGFGHSDSFTICKKENTITLEGFHKLTELGWTYHIFNDF